MQRRRFLQASVMAAVGLSAASPIEALAAGEAPQPRFPKSFPTGYPHFPTSAPRWRATWDAALAALAANTQRVPGFGEPVLLEGAVYPGIWQECAPLEGLVYAGLGRHVPQAEGQPTPLQVARNNHAAFFTLQREDGQLPASIKKTETGYGQIQMVVPIAATAWELAETTADEPLLETAYSACSRWDAWLRRFRNMRGTGLVEGFCTYDTGQDNSPRWRGVPNRCPDGDARRFPAGVGVPRLCPDLSAAVYGGRVALAKMARALGRRDEAMRWDEEAEVLRRLIVTKLYSPEDAAFYDVDTDGRFVKVRGDVLSRVLGEHVLLLEDAGDRRIFAEVWDRQVHNPKAFWTRYPLPSIALDDPAFVRPIPRNSWGGASQALTALRAPRWMEHYGKGAEMRVLMRAWVDAIVASAPSDTGGGEFRQQMDPVTGAFTIADPGGYSPAALVYLEFVRRLGES